jgi:hypothetical protein
LKQEITYTLDPDYVLAKIPKKWFKFDVDLGIAIIQKKTNTYVYLKVPKNNYVSHVIVMNFIYKQFVSEERFNVK